MKFLKSIRLNQWSVMGVFLITVNGFASHESSIAISQEVSEIKTKPMDVLQTQDGMKRLSLLQKQYRENLVRRKTVVASPLKTKKIISRPKTQTILQPTIQLAE